MPRFDVLVREVHVSHRIVEDADSMEEAVEKIVKDGEGKYEETFCEFSHTLDSDTWTVEELEKLDD